MNLLRAINRNWMVYLATVEGNSLGSYVRYMRDSVVFARKFNYCHYSVTTAAGSESSVDVQNYKSRFHCGLYRLLVVLWLCFSGGRVCFDGECAEVGENQLASDLHNRIRSPRIGIWPGEKLWWKGLKVYLLSVQISGRRLDKFPNFAAKSCPLPSLGSK
jgi:hypothetical protein